MPLRGPFLSGICRHSEGQAAREPAGIGSCGFPGRLRAEGKLRQATLDAPPHSSEPQPDLDPGWSWGK